MLGNAIGREETINWDRVNLTRQDLSHLEEPFSEQEVKEAIMELHSEKAPGPDGFIEKFFKCCWNIVKDDLLLAVQFFYDLHGQHFNLLNSVHIVLIPKIVDATELSHFRPMSYHIFDQ